MLFGDNVIVSLKSVYFDEICSCRLAFDSKYRYISTVDTYANGVMKCLTKNPSRSNRTWPTRNGSCRVASIKILFVVSLQLGDAGVFLTFRSPVHRRGQFTIAPLSLMEQPVIMGIGRQSEYFRHLLDDFSIFFLSRLNFVFIRFQFRLTTHRNGNHS